MENNIMNQKAGDNSSLIQIENIQVGPSLDEIKQLIIEENKRALDNYCLIASDVSNNRLKEYSEIFLPKMVKEEILSAFSEPSFQFAFRESIKTAVCTDRKMDYEILSELLVRKYKKKDDVTISAAIEKAIQEVNNISFDSLMTLTIIYSVITYIPTSPIASEGMKALNTLYKKLLKDFSLPETKDWIENLDITNAIRLGTYGGSKRFEDFFYERYKDYIIKGIKCNSKKYNDIVQKMLEVGLSTDLLIPNELEGDYVRLKILNKNQIDNVRITINDGKKKTETELNENQKECINSIFDSYEKADSKTKDRFKDIMLSMEYIKTIMEWWNKSITKISINITPIGEVLAYTNANRIDCNLPTVDKFSIIK